MRKRPYAKAQATSTTSRSDRLKATVARMKARRQAARAEEAKKEASRLVAASRKRKTSATNVQQKKKSAPAKKMTAAKNPKSAPSKKMTAAEKPVPPKNPRTGRSGGSVDSKTNMDFDAAPRNTNRNPRARNQSMQRDVTGGVKTRAGTYKTFKKKSAAAGSFRSAFATARKAGKKTFTWNGKRYTTAVK